MELLVNQTLKDLWMFGNKIVVPYLAFEEVYTPTMFGSSLHLYADKSLEYKIVFFYLFYILIIILICLKIVAS